MTITKLHGYKNGDYIVSLYSNGTKIRKGCSPYRVDYPESIDLKITSFCRRGCDFCYEDACPCGSHASVDWIMNMLRGLPQGVEIALGGGDPLTHPMLHTLCAKLSSVGLVANITVNKRCLEDFGVVEKLATLSNCRLIHGIGVSYCARSTVYPYITPNTVIHLIAGVHSIDDLDYVIKLNDAPKILVLGFKTVGRGASYYEENKKKVDDNLNTWREKIPEYFGRFTLCFDNLAIDQLEIKNHFEPEEWQRLYMGDDGRFTMYVDAVEREYGLSSTSELFPMGALNIKEAFSAVRRLS